MLLHCLCGVIVLGIIHFTQTKNVLQCIFYISTSTTILPDFFPPQVMRIIDNVQPSRQTVMFSATFPRQVEALAKKILTKPIEITVISPFYFFVDFNFPCLKTIIQKLLSVLLMSGFEIPTTLCLDEIKISLYFHILSDWAVVQLLRDNWCFQNDQCVFLCRLVGGLWYARM